jgi:tRNA pseudouridine38-40 synthase
MLRTIYLLVAYDGTDFHGWQQQAGLRTVQGVLEQAVRRVVRHQADLVGCGRTDAGVHAAGHVSSFDTTCELAADRLRHAVGARLPKDVSVIQLRFVQPGFDARRDAISKLYRYRIHNAEGRPVEHVTQRYTYHFWHPLDLDAMRAASRDFVGEKDFSALAGQGDTRESKVRTVLRCDVERHYDEIRIDVEGKGFLYNQVRNMVGTLIEVGRGHWEPDYVAEILASGDRAKAGPTAPAPGLCLQWLRYPASRLRPPREAGVADGTSETG